MWKKLLKTIAFLLVFVLLFLGVSRVLCYSGDLRNYQWIAGFYQEPRESLDAVYIGSSTCYAFWNSLVAWKNYGIAVYPYSSNAQHFVELEYLIREVRKTQPNALIIVNTNTIGDYRMSAEKFHHLLDYMPFSLNKLRLTNYIVKTADLTIDEAIALYVPLYRYHDSWSQPKRKNIRRKLNGMKGASSYSTYNSVSMDISGLYIHSEERSDLPDYIIDAANSLMDYCEKENVRILFITVPRAESEDHLLQLNELNAMLEARGFDTLYLLDQPEVPGIDLETDFYNEGHTNIHGSIKFTNYLSRWIAEHYGLKNKQGEAQYASWDRACEKYTNNTLNKYTLDIELDSTCRDYSLARPEVLQIPEENGGITVSWSPAAGADGYLVYRRPTGGTWELLTETTDTRYPDDVSDALSCDYTVVPFRNMESGRLYGNFDYCNNPPEQQ